MGLGRVVARESLTRGKENRITLHVTPTAPLDSVADACNRIRLRSRNASSWDLLFSIVRTVFTSFFDSVHQWLRSDGAFRLIWSAGSRTGSKRPAFTSLSACATPSFQCSAQRLQSIT